MANSIKPLKAKTMTLEELQMETLKLISRLHLQLNRMPHEGGLSDQEFWDQQVKPLENRIWADMEIMRSDGAPS